MRTAAVAAIAAAVLLLAGCGGGDSTAAPVATDTVELVKSYRFSPDAVRVAPGTTVTWHNDDNFTHTVRVDGDEAVKLSPGDSFTRRFPRRGTFDYVCTLHPGMEGEVVVG